MIKTIKKLLIKLGIIKPSINKYLVEEYDLEENLKRISKIRPKTNKFLTDEELKEIKKDAFKPNDFDDYVKTLDKMSVL